MVTLLDLKPFASNLSSQRLGDVDNGGTYMVRVYEVMLLPSKTSRGTLCKTPPFFELDPFQKITEFNQSSAALPDTQQFFRLPGMGL